MEDLDHIEGQEVKNHITLRSVASRVACLFLLTSVLLGPLPNCREVFIDGSLPNRSGYYIIPTEIGRNGVNIERGGKRVGSHGEVTVCPSVSSAHRLSGRLGLGVEGIGRDTSR